jgi:hypothetical protein
MNSLTTPSGLAHGATAVAPPPAQTEATPPAAAVPVASAAAEVAPATQPRWALALNIRLAAMRARLRGLLLTSMSRSTLWPYVAVISPLIVTTVLAPLWLSFVMGVLSLVALNQVAPKIEPGLWAVDGRSAFLRYVVPLQVLLLLWVGAAAAMGRGEQIAAVVFPYIATLCLVIAPACRWQRARQTRRLPLRWSLGAASVLTALVHGSAALSQWSAA